MKKISDVLQEIYSVDWSLKKILECGANKFGEETSNLSNVSECWYIEANPIDFTILSGCQKNVLNLAISDHNGKTNFNVCHGSGSGLSGISFDKNHLKDLEIMNVTYETIEVNCITYSELLNKLKIVFDVLVLDVEGYETKILKTFFEMKKNLLPDIIVIECGHDWQDRLSLLKALGFSEDCYYFNNCYLTKKESNVIKNFEELKKINVEWKYFKWGDKIIYENNL